ncbi:hypothetical protein [Gemmatimonas groenlandica]|uniref:Uncharacterized protein n=1 Tax=Gemmatimonas groenlandica TaxID=2732249 RepID=A0A6M4IP30_9BACT|nr:hypothetical protein [Gemmatimonas groenlandica]QJR34722.1 hypothetical protein HKW67_03935 [Gemmatimonas groenlandica]
MSVSLSVDDGSGPTALRSGTTDDLTAVQQLLTMVKLPIVGVDMIFGLRAEDFVVATYPAQPAYSLRPPSNTSRAAVPLAIAHTDEFADACLMCGFH